MTHRLNRGKLLLVSFLSAFLVLMICSKSSFLYPMNDWVDVNCFFTVGRAIKHGKLPYLDLYEQKGPLLYILFFLASLISEQSFTGVFMVEVLCLTLFLYESGQVILLWIEKQGIVCCFLPLLALAVCVSTAFSHGTSAEELFLPVLAASLRIVLTQMRRGELLSRRQLLALGLFAGSALWYKYTFCGFFIGLFAAVLIWYITSGNARRIPMAILMAASGAVALSAMILGWFALRGGLSALIEAYFTNNLGEYTQSFGPRHDPPLTALMKNWPWSLPAAVGLVFFLVRIRREWKELLTVLCTFGVLFFFTYYNGRSYPYYALIFSVFAPLGVIPAALLISGAISRPMPRLAWAACSLTAALSVFLAYQFSGNVYLMGTDQKDMPQYRFAETIRQEEQASLLNEGFLDGGFYLAAGVEPANRYFCTLNMRLPDMEQEHAAMIREGTTDFVITRNRKLDESAPYQLVDQCTFPFEGRDWTYYLYP